MYMMDRIVLFECSRSAHVPCVMVIHNIISLCQKQNYGYLIINAPLLPSLLLQQPKSIFLKKRVLFSLGICALFCYFVSPSEVRIVQNLCSPWLFGYSLFPLSVLFHLLNV